MIPDFKVYVKDPSNVSSAEKSITNSVIQLIKSRFKESTSMSTQGGEVMVGLFFNRADIPSDFQNVCEKVFYKNIFLNKPSNWTPFEISLKAGLKLIDYKSIDNICIVIGENTFSEEDIFAINKSSTDTPQYIAIDPIYSLEDVIMNQDERESILRSLAIITERQLIFEKWGFSNIDRNTKSILCFHGAPGTGKTMCAHAVAKQLKKKILIGSYSQIQSKFVGEGEKNLVSYFEAAQEQDAVLFIDEADTFLSRRLPSSNENSKHYNSMSNELYTLIENFNGCIIFASNHISDFDPAVISRIIEPIEFKLPNDEARKLIIEKMIPSKVPLQLTESNFFELISISKGFSGRDIRKAVLVFLSTAAYNYKVLRKIDDESIKLVFDDVYSAFKHVKNNKDNLNNSIKNKKNANVLIVESAKKNIRILQVAANALWADGRISQSEKVLFDELCDKFGVSLNIEDKNSIPPLHDICNTILSKTEKVQMLDIACRMVAIDGLYTDEEQNFINELITLIGFKKNQSLALKEYINLLVKENKEWMSIAESWTKSEYDILSELQKEYSEGASWYKLGVAYKSGGTICGITFNVDLKRAIYCLNIAASKGYQKASEEINNIQ